MALTGSNSPADNIQTPLLLNPYLPFKINSPVILMTINITEKISAIHFQPLRLLRCITFVS